MRLVIKRLRETSSIICSAIWLHLKEVCPFWPGKPATAHWGFPDPSQVQGSDEDKRRAFKDVMIGLKKRIDLLADMPLETLDSLSLNEIHTKS